MRLESFHVQGFKSLVDVTLENLGDINVFHGPNNVGKSNVLEAIDLFFRQLPGGRSMPSGGMMGGEMAGMPGMGMKSAGGPPASRRTGRVFNVFRPGPMRLQAEFSVAVNAETGRFGVELLVKPQTRETPTLEGAWAVRTDGSRNDLMSRAPSSPVGPPADLPHELASALWQPSASGKPLAQPFSLVDAARRTSEGAADGVGIVAQSLRDHLFDLKEHPEAPMKRAWGLFRGIFSDLPSPVGPIDLDTSFDRSTGRANLIQITNGSSILLDDLGTGIQQLVAIVGHLLTTNASIVAIEEPELNLSYGMQKVLRGMLERIVKDPAGPSQLFLTSHSPAFDGQDSFYRVSMVDRETHVDRAAPGEKWSATQWPTDKDREDASRPPEDALGGYVTSDGLVELPEKVIADMGLQSGESVLFAKDDDGYWKLVGPREWDGLMGDITDE